MDKKIILAIESSCDDTSVALLEASSEGFFVLKQKTASQVELHAKYGGVIPELAGRKHAEAIMPIIEELLEDAPEIDCIAVTAGPGLITGLLVGVQAAKALSYLLDKPILPIHHIEGHLHAPMVSEKDNPLKLEDIKFPVLVLTVSGGHTELMKMNGFGEYEVLGKTRDDAAGECFDKVAKMMGMPYPGGPKISKAAVDGESKAIDLPVPMKGKPGYDFSFAGLKTAARYYLRDNPDYSKEDVSASLQRVIVESLVLKVKKAVSELDVNGIMLTGGVSANPELREKIKELADSKGLRLYLPMMKYCMDNASMIGAAAYHHILKGKKVDWKSVEADPQWKLV